MFVEVIHSLFETLVNVEMADMLSEPLSVLVVLLLVSALFLLCASGKTKRIVFISILVLTLVLCVFSIASAYGFIQIPITLGG